MTVFLLPQFKQLMLRIDPEENDEDGEAKPAKIKIDQNLFQYPKARPSGPTVNDTPSSASGSSSVEVSPVKSSSNSAAAPGTPQYACIVQNSNTTPVAKVISFYLQKRIYGNIDDSCLAEKCY